MNPPFDVPPAPVAVLLAAGAGRRMGGRPKALLRRAGQTLLQRQLGLLAQAGCRQIAVALGHHAPLLQAQLQQVEPLPGAVALSWAVNPQPDDGPASSLRCALALLPADAPTILVLLADQPLLELMDLHEVLAAWQTRPAGVQLVLPQHAGQPGHPLVFGPALRAQVQGGQGVRDWRRAHPGQVLALEQAHARCTTDVDSPQDVQELQRRYGVALQW